MRIWHLALVVLLASLLFHLAHSLQIYDLESALLSIQLLSLIIFLEALRRQIVDSRRNPLLHSQASLSRRILWWSAVSVQCGAITLGFVLLALIGIVFVLSFFWNIA